MDPSGHGAHARRGEEVPAAHKGHAPPDRAQARGLATEDGGLRFQTEPTIVAAGEKEVTSSRFGGAISRHLRFDVTREGKRVEVEPYLGA